MSLYKEVKVIIPLSDKDYRKGMGEHISAILVNVELSDKKGQELTFFIKLLQDSIFYCSLPSGYLLKVELNSDNNFIVPYSEIPDSVTLIQKLNQQKEEAPTLNVIEHRIDDLRKEMLDLADKFGRSNEKVIRVSQNLDAILNVYQSVQP